MKTLQSTDTAHSFKYSMLISGGDLLVLLLLLLFSRLAGTFQSVGRLMRFLGRTKDIR